MTERIMLVDDEPNVFEGLRRAFRRLRPDWEVEMFADPLQALKRARSALFDVFVSDFRMPMMNGVEFLTGAREVQPEAVRIILSGQVDVDDLVKAINESRVDRLVLKPADPSSLASTIDQALEYRRILVENRRLADQVRSQQDELDRRKTALDEFAERHPELAMVRWDEEGSIILCDRDHRANP